MRSFLLSAFGIPFLLTVILVPIALKLAVRLKLVDAPSSRKLHTRATPLMGGLAVYGAVVIYEASNGQIAGKVLALVAACGVAVLLGLMDDRFDIPSRFRLAVHFALALLLALGGFRTQLLPIPLDIIFSIVWISGMINAMNCIDCADGICGGISAIMMTSYGIMLTMAGHRALALICFAVSGAVAGFLVFNFPPARIFMGDCGSTALGLLVGAISLRCVADSAPQYVVYTLSPVILPVVDILYVHVRRYMNGMHSIRDLLASTGKDHLPHRYLKLGLSPRAMAITVYLIAILFAAVPAAVRTRQQSAPLLLATGIGVVLFMEWRVSRVSRSTSTAAA